MQQRKRTLSAFIPRSAILYGIAGMTLVAGPALAQTAQELEAANPNPNDWLSYHGTYKGYNFSGLDQINASNVKDLQVAWIHFPGRTTRGMQSMPLARTACFTTPAPTAACSLWTAPPARCCGLTSLNSTTQLVARQTHSPYNRGIAMGDGKVFIGTVDGRLIALDIKTGKPAWDSKLIDSAKLTVGFTGAPIFVRKGTVVIGAQGGEWPYRGPIFGVDAATGKKKWEFLTRGGTRRR